jgi:multidrug transporter EmrE-like cation transporter
MDFNNIFWLIIAAITPAIPVSFMKYYIETKNIRWIIFSIMSYLLLIYAYYIILNNKNIIVIYTISKALSILVVVFSGYFLFNDKLDAKSITAILLLFASLYLLQSSL